MKKLLAFFALLIAVPVVALTTLGTPEIGIETTGTCRNIVIRDHSGNQVTIGCINDLYHVFFSLNGDYSIVQFIAAGETTIDNALPRAVTALNARGGGRLRFPQQASCYLKSNTFTITSDNITFQGETNTTCINDSSTGDYFVVGDGTANPHFNGFANLTINPVGRTLSITGNTHSSTTIDGLSSTAGLVVGQAISGNGIPPATITAIGSGTLTTSSAATSTNAAVALTVYQPGAAIRLRNTYGATISNIIFGGTQTVAIDVDGGANQYSTHIDRIKCFGGVSCIRVGNAGSEAQETWISDSLPSGQTTAGIELINAGGTYLKNNSYLINYHSMYIHPSTGQFVTGLGSDNEVMDAGWGSCLLIDTTGGGIASEGIFTSLWAATCSTQLGANAATTEPGVYLKGSEATLRGFQFPNIRVVNTNAVGIQLDGGRDLDFSGHVAMNSAGTLAGFPGFFANTNVSHFSFRGRSGALMTHITGIGAGNALSKQTYGAVVNCGTSDYYEIDIDGTGNQTGGVSDCGSGTHKSVRDRGTSDLKSSMVASASAFSFQAASRAPSSANSGNAGMELLTPAGEKSMFGVQDGVGGWWQCALPGTANRLCMINPNGGGVSLGPTAGYPKNVAANSPATFSSSIPIGDGGTGQATAPAARGASGLNVESGTGRGDSIYTILATDRWVFTNAAFTASRTWTLPAANAVNAGAPLIVDDAQGTVTATNTLVVSRAGSDTINGGTSFTIDVARGRLILFSDGVSKWTARLQRPYGTAAGNAVYLDINTGRLPPVDGSSLTNLNASNLGSGTVPAARGGAGTINGALKSDGSGNVSQAGPSDLSGLGTGVATALGVNVGTAGAPVVNGGALGTPSSGSAANLTGLPYAGISAVAPTTYTPTVTANGGSPAYTSRTGDYIQIGKQVCFRAGWNQSVAGTGFMTVDLPVAPNLTSSLVASGTGQETATTGDYLFWSNRGSDATARVTNFSASYPAGGVGAHYSISGCYFAS